MTVAYQCSDATCTNCNFTFSNSSGGCAVCSELANFLLVRLLTCVTCSSFSRQLARDSWLLFVMIPASLWASLTMLVVWQTIRLLGSTVFLMDPSIPPQEVAQQKSEKTRNAKFSNFQIIYIFFNFFNFFLTMLSLPLVLVLLFLDSDMEWCFGQKLPTLLHS